MRIKWSLPECSQVSPNASYWYKCTRTRPFLDKLTLAILWQLMRVLRTRRVRRVIWWLLAIAIALSVFLSVAILFASESNDSFDEFIFQSDQGNYSQVIVFTSTYIVF